MTVTKRIRLYKPPKPSRRLRIILVRLWYPPDGADARLRGRDGALAVERSQHEVVGSLLAMRERDEFASLPREGAARQMVGAGLDAERILPGLEMLPLRQARQLRLVDFDREAEAERIVDDRIGRRGPLASAARSCDQTCSSKSSRGAGMVR